MNRKTTSRKCSISKSARRISTERRFLFWLLNYIYDKENMDFDHLLIMLQILIMFSVGVMSFFMCKLSLFFCYYIVLTIIMLYFFKSVFQVIQVSYEN